MSILLYSHYHSFCRSHQFLCVLKTMRHILQNGLVQQFVDEMQVRVRAFGNQIVVSIPVPLSGKRPSAENVIEYLSKGIAVAGRCWVIATTIFKLWGNVVTCPYHFGAGRSPLLHISQVQTQPKVTDSHGVVISNEDIRRLQITMDDFPIVSR